MIPSDIASRASRSRRIESQSENLVIRLDDLSGEANRALIARPIKGMYETSPPESVHAFDIEKLKDPAVTFWSVWNGGEIAGCGALKDMGGGRGEIKSMARGRCVPRQRRRRRGILEHIMDEPRSGHEDSLLETGSSAAFKPALSLYASKGFKRCGPSRATPTTRSRSS